MAVKMFGLSETITTFAQRAFDLTDADLDRPWAWSGYEEGIRFAFFRTYEELRELATRLYTQRQASPTPMTTAQHILAQYHAAFRDLQAVLLGVGDELAQQPPAPEEWPLQRVLLHMVEAEGSFLFANQYAIERERMQDGRPQTPSEEAWDVFWSAELLQRFSKTSSFSELLDYHRQLHQHVLETFASVSDAELGIQAVFWEPTAMPVEFRLHRFDSHLRQHTIQAEKTLVALGVHSNEARRLLRLIYSALAEAESVQIGADGFGEPDCQAAAVQISQRIEEILPK
jgi:hypothetical protein